MKLKGLYLREDGDDGNKGSQHSSDVVAWRVNECEGSSKDEE